jgi:hypothetical protein
MDAGTAFQFSMGKTEQQIRAWAKQTREQLARGHERERAIFDRGPDLPAPSIIAAAGIGQTVGREALVAFLQAKLKNLERVIADLAKGL